MRHDLRVIRADSHFASCREIECVARVLNMRQTRGFLIGFGEISSPFDFVEIDPAIFLKHPRVKDNQNYEHNNLSG